VDCEICRHRKGYRPGWKQVKTREGAPPNGYNNGGKSKRITLGRRARIYLRDSYTCMGCGLNDPTGKALTIDHIKPRSKGGTNDDRNLQTMCSPCNNAKGDTWPWPPERIASPA